MQLTDDEFAALQTCLYLLEGRFAYSEPLRLALQNLALGRGGFDQRPLEAAQAVEVTDPDYSTEMVGRLTKLEGAISKQRTIKFAYWTISRDKEEERSVNPYALLSDNGVWYVIGLDLERGDIRTFRVSRVRGEIRFATRRERDFRQPEDFDPSIYRGRPPWQVGDVVGEAAIEVAQDTAWWVERVYAGRGEVENGVFRTSSVSSPRGSCGRTAAPVRSSLRSSSKRSSAPSSSSATGTRRSRPASQRWWPRRTRRRRSSGPSAPWRRSGSPSSRRCSRISLRVAGTRRMRRSRPPSSRSGSTSHPTSSRTTCSS